MYSYLHQNLNQELLVLPWLPRLNIPFTIKAGSCACSWRFRFKPSPWAYFAERNIRIYKICEYKDKEVDTSEYEAKWSGKVLASTSLIVYSADINIILIFPSPFLFPFFFFTLFLKKKKKNQLKKERGEGAENKENGKEKDQNYKVFTYK